MYNVLHGWTSTWAATAAFVVTALALLSVLIMYLHTRHLAKRAELECSRQLSDSARALRSSRADTRALLDQQSTIVMVFDRDTLTLQFANRTALDLFGCQSIEALSDTLLMRPDAWQPPPYSLQDFEQWVAQLKNRGALSGEWLFMTGSHGALWTDCALANTVFEGKAARMLSAQSIHPYKLDRLADQLRNRVLASISAGAPLENLIANLGKLAELRFRAARCQISLYDPQRDLLTPMGQSSLNRALKSALPTIAVQYGATCIGSAAFTRSRVVCTQIASDHRWQGFTQFAIGQGVGASWSEPVISQSNELLGVVTLFGEGPLYPDEDSVVHMTALVSLLNLAVERQNAKLSLEAALGNERFIRQIGVELVNLDPHESDGEQLASILQRLLARYELGNLALWEQQVDESHYRVLASSAPRRVGDTETASSATIETAQVVNAALGRSAEYITQHDDLHQRMCLSNNDKPILLIPLTDPQNAQLPLGILAVQSQYIYIAKPAIEHLQILGSVLRTVLLNRRLVNRLSRDKAHEQSERYKLETELSVARNIQMAMVPGHGEFKEHYKNWTIEAWLNPARAVGGDLYEFIRLRDGRVLVAVGDVSDKGAPAALFMVKAVSLLNYLARIHEGDLAHISAALNCELCRSNEACMFVTMVMGVLDLSSGETQWINAGHNAPMYLDGTLEPTLWTTDSGPPMGLYEDASYHVESRRVSPGHCITLYSDGVTEAFNPEGLEFGDDRLIGLGYRGATQAEGLLDYYRTQLMAFIRQAPQSDDVTLVTIQHHGHES